jgi:GTPase SAR1 family protein
LFDITNWETFYHAHKYWISELKSKTAEETVIFLVGNKNDLEQDREITREDAEKVAEEYGLKYWESSAKSSIDVQRIFEELVRSIDSSLSAEGLQLSGYSIASIPKPTNNCC